MNENYSNLDVLEEAVLLLYKMDKFVLDSYDNETWLIYGVPDGEFEESNEKEVIDNYKDHDWLVADIDTGKFSIDEFKEFLNTFKACTRNKSDYNQQERLNLIKDIESFIQNRSGVA